MGRFVTGITAFIPMLTGAFLLWQAQYPVDHAGAADRRSAVARRRNSRRVPSELCPPASAPEASPKSREQRRFSRADKDKDRRVETEEISVPR